MALTIQQLHDLLEKEVVLYTDELRGMDGSRMDNYHFIRGRRAEAAGIIELLNAELRGETEVIP